MLNRSDAFTLVELLVVIAIISVLAAMLLPGLENAMEQSRRSVCANTLKQQAVGITTYVADYDGKLPLPISEPDWLGPTFTEQSAITCKGNTGGGVYNKLSPNAILYGKGYWTSELVNCASMDFRLRLVPPPNLASSTLMVYGTTTLPNTRYAFGYTHYCYRFNSRCEDGSVKPENSFYHPRAMSIAGYQLKALSWDQANSSRDATTLMPRDASVHFMFKGAWSDWYNYDMTRRMKWAHRDGGNIVRFDGSATWLDNRLSTSSHAGTYVGTSWPGIYWTYNGFYPGTKVWATSNPGVYSGIDYWMKK